MYETIVILLLAIGILYWSAREFQKYLTSPTNENEELMPYTQARLRRRLSVSIILLIILAMIGFRDFVESIAPYRSLLLAYYGFCLVLALLLFFFALAELAETTRQLQKARKNLVETSLHQLTGELQELQKLKSEAQAPQESKENEKGDPPGN